MKTKIILISSIINLLIFESLIANNIQVTGAILTGQVPASNYTLVQFDLSWENSWRDAVNWDAAWVFVKYRTSYDTTWKHATLNTISANHTIPSGFTGSPASDGVGIFIHRSSSGNGNVSLTNVKLRWEYGTNGVNDADLVTVKVFAIEMVYIPQGSFYAGDGTTQNSTGQFSQGTTTSPFLITGEGALTLGGTPTTNLGNRSAQGMTAPDDFNNATTQTLPAAFPKGYNDFYCMKYELSQGQYTDFLNTLTRTQQQSRVFSNISTDVITTVFVMSSTSSVLNRNVIVCPGSGNGTLPPIIFSCDRPDRACNFLLWPDGCAYMDWAGLRPMTELELEKVCRGTLAPVADEYAWGNTTVVSALVISGTENGTETITTANANCLCGTSLTGGDGGSGPLRCGIFSKVSTTRILAGATYYGIMEMSGNLAERIVTVGNASGRLFDGQHGNGILSTLGNANLTNWPGNISGEITSTNGSGLRMGSWSETISSMRISTRISAALISSTRQTNIGFRGVRTSEVGTFRPNNK